MRRIVLEEPPTDLSDWADLEPLAQPEASMIELRQITIEPPRRSCPGAEGTIHAVSGDG